MNTVFSSRQWIKLNQFYLGKNQSLQVPSQKTEEDEDKAINSSPFFLCSQDLLNHLCASCLHRSQVLKSFPGKKTTASSLNSFLYAFVKEGKDAFMSVREGCRWSKAFLAMKCSLRCAIQLETTLTVLFVGPGSTWWRGNNCAVRSREQAPTYIRFLALVLHHTSWHDYCDHLRNRVFFFLLDFSLPT